MTSNKSASDPSTLKFYDENAEHYSSHRPDHATPELFQFLPILRPGSRVLELGCGSGRDAAEMQRLGFEVDATDGTAAMAELASKQEGLSARVLRFEDLDAVESYDAIVACASLLHVPHAALPSILARVWKALKPGGWHFASYKTANQEGWDTHQRYYNYLSRQNAEEYYAKAGVWTSIQFDEYDGVGHFSAPSRWLKVTSRKARGEG